ncbi:F0F1 ATP synthase subunit beta [Mycoplasmopsis mucosicanis]|uniref:F0F1 ATP synthase subunit beta n=2 Tax=Mycoplasmopsis mucosicanis TaxID=458208 RepID=A0A507SQ54_9BACT|nr:F0F1 ATP synthase subunit beta [Mycoplasmopsis mucosicanis]TQC51512.1 F0F1 ATP synthase subunit beta [Mycoplasmopsis mucosicanis]
MARISSITDDIIEIKFPDKKLPKPNVIITLHEGKSSLMVKRIIDEETVLAVVVYAFKPISLDDELNVGQISLKVPVGQSSKNNIFNIYGKPLLENNKELQYIEMNSVPRSTRFNDSKPEIMETGIKAIDFFIPILKGHKLGIFGGAGVGKTVVMKEIIFNVNKKDSKTSNIFIGSGERSREAIELYDELKESNLMDNSIMFVSKINEFPGARSSIVPLGVTAAEYLRDIDKQDVLLFVDNMYRYVQAENEVSASLGKKPSVGGYQSTLESDIANVQERLFKNENGSITAFETVFLPMDDLSDPSAVAVFNHLDGNMVLSREQTAKGIYPAFEPLASSSNTVNEKIIGKRHYDAIVETKRILKAYRDLEDIILILGFDELDEDNKIIVKKALQLENFFTQNFFMTEHFTKSKGVYVPLKDTVESVIRILEGKFINQNPEIFSYIGSNLSMPTDKEIEAEKAIQKMQ